jgi:hypothetical protein
MKLKHQFGKTIGFTKQAEYSDVSVPNQIKVADVTGSGHK